MKERFDQGGSFIFTGALFLAIDAWIFYEFHYSTSATIRVPSFLYLFYEFLGVNTTSLIVAVLAGLAIIYGLYKFIKPNIKDDEEYY